MIYLHDRVAQDWEDAIPMEVICRHYELVPSEVFYLLARAGKPTDSYWKKYDEAAMIYHMFTATAVRCDNLEASSDTRRDRSRTGRARRPKPPGRYRKVSSTRTMSLYWVQS